MEMHGDEASFFDGGADNRPFQPRGVVRAVTPPPDRRIQSGRSASMNENEQSLLHSWVTTIWGGVFKGRGEGDSARQARNDLLVRYHEAVYHYFLAKIRDPNAAHELYSNFAVKLIETDRFFKNADPSRGRFRHYLKAALHHMVIDYYRSRARGAQVRRMSFDPAQHDVVAVPDDERDGDFSPIWRQELLNQAWKALQALEQRTGQVHYTVLRCQSDNPDLKAPQLAERLSDKLGKTLTPDGVRQALHRARERFAQLLLEEVERTMESPTLEELEEELIDQQLLPYCKKALEKRRQERG
jgi:RNA polymerase sigma-70 factor (ECF subfamily)